MSPRLPTVTPREALAALKGAGFFVYHIRGSHHILKHPDKRTLRVVVALHNKPLKKGTLRAIIR